MALKPRIYKAVIATKVPEICVPEFSSCIDLKLLGKETYTVICYPGMRNETSSIVNSKNMKKALASVTEEPHRVVAIAHSFTEEAKQALNAYNAVCFYKSDYYWSDSSLERIREFK